jgi:hypothetical protein
MVGRITLYRYNEMRECEDIQVMCRRAATRKENQFHNQF